MKNLDVSRKGVSKFWTKGLPWKRWRSAYVFSGSCISVTQQPFIIVAAILAPTVQKWDDMDFYCSTLVSQRYNFEWYSDETKHQSL
jgi:hypothetical protein